MLIGVLSAGVPPVPNLNVPENDRLSCDDKMVEFLRKLDWSTSRGYCSTVELVRIVVRNGLLRTTPFCL